MEEDINAISCKFMEPLILPNSDFDCAFMIDWLKNQKVALASISPFLLQKNSPYSSLLKLFYLLVKVATSSEDLAITFEFAISAESKSEYHSLSYTKLRFLITKSKIGWCSKFRFFLWSCLVLQASPFLAEVALDILLADVFVNG